MFDNPQNLFSLGALVLIILLIILVAVKERSIIKLTEFIGNTPTELINLGKVLAKEVISVDTMQQIIQTGSAIKTYTPDQIDRLVDVVLKLSAQLADKTNLLPPELQTPPADQQAVTAKAFTELAEKLQANSLRTEPPEPDTRPESERFGSF